jgi:hypothetical protein
MRGSDVVDLLFDWLPRRWVRVVLFVVLAVMYFTHWYEPVYWYVADRAAWYAETWTGVWQHAIATMVPTPSVTVGT